MNRFHNPCVFFFLFFACLGSVAQGEERKPVSMSAAEFSQLPTAEQRALLVQIFQRRLEHSKNLSYEVELSLFIHENRNGEPGKLREEGPFRKCRHWRLSDSYRLDSDMYRPQAKEPTEWVAAGFDAEEGIARCTVRGTENSRTYGRIDTKHDPLIEDNHYNCWLSGEHPYKEHYLFHYLLDHEEEFEIEALLDQGQVKLTVGYQPAWAKKPGGKCVFHLDPGKGFLPIRGDSRWDEKPQWRTERFVVKESRLVGDVWMPIKLRKVIDSSSAPETMAIHEMVITQIEYGKVTPVDLEVPFTKDMKIVDAIKGVTYHTDAQGNPTGTIEAVFGGTPIDMPAEEKRWPMLIIANSAIVLGLLVALFIRRKYRQKAAIS